MLLDLIFVCGCIVLVDLDRLQIFCLYDGFVCCVCVGFRGMMFLVS